MKTQNVVPQFSSIVISFYYYYSSFKVIERIEKAKNQTCEDPCCGLCAVIILSSTVHQHDLLYYIEIKKNKIRPLVVAPLLFYVMINITVSP